MACKITRKRKTSENGKSQEYTTHNKRRKLTQDSSPLYCICRRGELEGQSMIQCSNSSCGEWFHLSCVGLNNKTKWYEHDDGKPIVFEDEFKCPLCHKENSNEQKELQSATPSFDHTSPTHSENNKSDPLIDDNNDSENEPIIINTLKIPKYTKNRRTDNTSSHTTNPNIKPTQLNKKPTKPQQSHIDTLNVVNCTTNDVRRWFNNKNNGLHNVSRNKGESRDKERRYEKEHHKRKKRHEKERRYERYETERNHRHNYRHSYRRDRERIIEKNKQLESDNKLLERVNNTLLKEIEQLKEEKERIQNDYQTLQTRNNILNEQYQKLQFETGKKRKKKRRKKKRKKSISETDNILSLYDTELVSSLDMETVMRDRVNTFRICSSLFGTDNVLIMSAKDLIQVKANCFFNDVKNDCDNDNDDDDGRQKSVSMSISICSE